MKDLSLRGMVELAVAEGATSPAPTSGKSWAWSTVLNKPVYWTGSLWTAIPVDDPNTAKTNAVQTYTAGQRGEVTALTDGATITPNFNDSNFFSVTLSGNRTLGNPTNSAPGQSGCIFITQDATGTRLLSFGSNWDFAGGVIPTISTAPNSVDRIDYVVRAENSIHAVLSKGWS